MITDPFQPDMTGFFVPMFICAAFMGDFIRERETSRLFIRFNINSHGTEKCKTV